MSKETTLIPAERFMFQLTKKEKNELVPICHRFKRLRHSTVLPYAFTERSKVEV